MEERFGAWQVGQSAGADKVQFKVFIPDRSKDPDQYGAKKDEQGNTVPDCPNYGDPQISRIQVVGDFQRHLGQAAWDKTTAPKMTKEPHLKGWQWVYTTPDLPAGFYEYKYLVTFNDGKNRLVSDPCCRYGGRTNQNAGVVVGGRHVQVTPLTDAQRKPLKDLVQYELHIDDFTAGYRGSDAPIKAVIDKLPYLQELGVNALAIMPWTAWPSEGYSWGYTPYLYFSVEQYYIEHLNASDAESPIPVPSAERLVWLKDLISECHRLGIHVIMDGVFNHVGCADLDAARESSDGFPYPWFYRDPDDCPYVGKYGGSFATLKDLDYHNGCTQQFIRDACLYWIDVFKIDAIRFDNTTNFYVDGDMDHGLPKLIEEIDGHVTQAGIRSFPLILEHIDMSAATVANKTGATSYWNDALYQRCFDSLHSGRIDTRLIDALNSHAGLSSGKVATTYFSNHDHSHAAWRAGAKNDVGSMEWFRLQPYVIALLTMPGSPLIQSGTEFGQDFWIVENDQNTGRRIRFRPLQWEMTSDRIGRALFDLHKRLIAIRHTYASLRADNFFPGPEALQYPCLTPEGYGVHVDKGVMIYHRWGQGSDGQLERFIIVLDFSPGDQWVDIPFPANGIWKDLLNDRSDAVSNFRLTGQLIGSNWGRIYLKKGA